MEIDVNELLNDPHFDESNFLVIEDYLRKNPSKLDYFMERFHMEKEDVLNWDVIYLIILDIIPYGPAMQYALENEDWEMSDFADYCWFQEGNYTIISKDGYNDFLAKQKA